MYQDFCQFENPFRNQSKTSLLKAAGKMIGYRDCCDMTMGLPNLNKQFFLSLDDKALEDLHPLIAGISVVYLLDVDTLKVIMERVKSSKSERLHIWGGLFDSIVCLVAGDSGRTDIVEFLKESGLEVAISMRVVKDRIASCSSINDSKELCDIYKSDIPLLTHGYELSKSGFRECIIDFLNQESFCFKSEEIVDLMMSALLKRDGDLLKRVYSRIGSIQAAMAERLEILGNVGLTKEVIKILGVDIYPFVSDSLDNCRFYLLENLIEEGVDVINLTGIDCQKILGSHSRLVRSFLSPTCFSCDDSSKNGVDEENGKKAIFKQLLSSEFIDLSEFAPEVYAAIIWWGDEDLFCLADKKLDFKTLAVDIDRPGSCGLPGGLDGKIPDSRVERRNYLEVMADYYPLEKFSPMHWTWLLIKLLSSKKGCPTNTSAVERALSNQSIHLYELLIENGVPFHMETSLLLLVKWLWRLGAEDHGRELEYLKKFLSKIGGDNPGQIKNSLILDRIITSKQLLISNRGSEILSLLIAFGFRSTPGVIDQRIKIIPHYQEADCKKNAKSITPILNGLKQTQIIEGISVDQLVKSLPSQEEYHHLLSLFSESLFPVDKDLKASISRAESLKSSNRAYHYEHLAQVVRSGVIQKKKKKMVVVMKALLEIYNLWTSPIVATIGLKPGWSEILKISLEKGLKLKKWEYLGLIMDSFKNVADPEAIAMLIDQFETDLGCNISYLDLLPIKAQPLYTTIETLQSVKNLIGRGYTFKNKEREKSWLDCVRNKLEKESHTSHVVIVDDLPIADDE